MDQPPPGIDRLVGRSLGAYQLVEIVGRGGMAVVYKALQPALRRYVAVKVLPPYFVHAPGFRDRFAQEAATVAHLEHPHILPVYDYGQEEEVPYFVMPLVTGGTLHGWLAQGPSLQRAMNLLGRVLDALGYAHSQGIVHRDVKPSNILLRQGDWPLLTDFGTAKLLGAAAPSQTSPHSIIGTPEYMAPEQSQGLPVGPHTDLYALGIIVYQVLTGRLPFEGPTPAALLIQHARDPAPPPCTLNPVLAPVWDDVIRRALAKDPRDRYATAAELKEDLLAAWRVSRANESVGQAGGPVDLGGLYEEAQHAFTLGQWVRVLQLCDQMQASEPWHHGAILLRDEAQRSLAISRPVAPPARSPPPAVPHPSPPTRPITGETQGAVLFVLNRQSGTVAVVDPASLQLTRTIAVGASPLGLAVHPAGTPLYVASRGGNQLVAIDTRAAQIVAQVAVGAGPHGVAVSPDGARVYVANRFADSVSAVDATRHQLAATIAVGRGPVSLAVHPLRPRLYVADSESDGISVVDTEVLAVVATLGAARLAAPEALAVHPDGSRLYVAGNHGDALCTFDLVSRKLAAMTTVGAGPCGIAVAPEGARVYVACWDESALCVLDAGGSGLIAATPLDGAPRGLAVSPDGRYLYVTVRGSGVAVLDAHTLQRIGSVPVEGGPHALALARLAP